MHHLDKLAAQISSATNISLLIGAGVSTAAKIPDFRSRGGLYDTLKPDLLTASPEDRQKMADDPTMVVSTDIFLKSQNPLPYHEVRRPFLIGLLDGKYKFTAAHAFFALLDKKFNGSGKKKFTLFDQNIDGLSLAAGVRPECHKSVHGTLWKIRCESCGEDGPSFPEFVELVRRNVKCIYQRPGDTDPESAPKESNVDAFKCKHCGKNALKPATVLYGGTMPMDFFEAVSENFSPLAKERGNVCDLLICAGSSLTVHPAASLPEHLDRSAPLVIINRDRTPVRRAHDHISDDIDLTFGEVAMRLGWFRELQEISESGRMAEQSVETLKKALPN